MLDTGFAKYCRVIAAVGAIILSSCDSSVVSESQDQSPRLYISNPLLDVDTFANIPSVLVDLSHTFEHYLRQSFELDFDLDSTTASAELDGQRLRIFPSRIGTTIVTITARDSDGIEESDEFVLHVLDPCPRAANPDEQEYFGYTVGEVVRFDYSKTSTSSWGLTTVVGEIQWTYSSETECDRGDRSVLVDERLTATKTYQAYHLDDPEVDQIVEDRSFAIQIRDSLTIPNYVINPFPRFLPSGSDQEITYQDNNATVVVGRDIGFISRSLWIHYGVTSDLWESFTRIAD